jgi:hypothetical protein
VRHGKSILTDSCNGRKVDAIREIGLAGTICEIAWHQGDDLFAAYDNRLLAAARYVARYKTFRTRPTPTAT